MAAHDAVESMPIFPGIRSHHQIPADYAWILTTAIVRPATRDEISARRAIVQLAPIGANTKRAPLPAG